MEKSETNPKSSEVKISSSTKLIPKTKRTNHPKRISSREQARTREILMGALLDCGLSTAGISQVLGIPRSTSFQIKKKLSKARASQDRDPRLLENAQAVVRENLRQSLLEKANLFVEHMDEQKVEAASLDRLARSTHDVVKTFDLLDENTSDQTQTFLTKMEQFMPVNISVTNQAKGQEGVSPGQSLSAVTVLEDRTTKDEGA